MQRARRTDAPRATLAVARVQCRPCACTGGINTTAAGWFVATPEGMGTFSGSDFHHNGDLTHYDDPFVINTGKIYGNLDDLRTESPRVQRKLIAAAKALIALADASGGASASSSTVGTGGTGGSAPAQLAPGGRRRWATASATHESDDVSFSSDTSIA